MPPVFTLKFHGVRGSLPVCSANAVKFGGATMCIEVRYGPHVLIFDAGSGIRNAGEELRANGVDTINLFISHWHYDHVLGLPFFSPLYNTATHLTLWSGHGDGASADELLGGLMRPPYFPVGPSVFRGTLITRDFIPPQDLYPVPGVVVRTLRVNHPGGSTAYRIEADGRAICIVTDVEHVPGYLDDAVVNFVQGADLMLYDSAYEDDEMCLRCGFGHSTWQQALRITQAAGVARVGFIHHAPSRTDADLEKIEQDAAEVFSGAFVARQGFSLLI